MEEIFDKIRARVAAVDPNGPRKVLGVLLINIQTADGIKNLTIDLKKLKVHEDVCDSPDVTLDIDEETFVQTAKRELPFCDALVSGKAKISGNTDLIATLQGVLENKE